MHPGHPHPCPQCAAVAVASDDVADTLTTLRKQLRTPRKAHQ